MNHQAKLEMQTIIKFTPTLYFYLGRFLLYLCHYIGLYYLIDPIYGPRFFVEDQNIASEYILIMLIVRSLTCYAAISNQRICFLIVAVTFSSKQKKINAYELQKSNGCCVSQIK